MRTVDILELLSTPLIVLVVVAATVACFCAVAWTISGFGYIAEKLLIGLRSNVSKTQKKMKN